MQKDIEMPSDVRCALGAIALLLELAGCHSGGYHRIDVQTPPVAGVDAPAIASLNELTAARPQLPGQTEQDNGRASAQVSDGDPAKASVPVVSNPELDEALTREPSPAESMVSLQTAIATSLVRNPDLIAARGQEQVGEAAMDVAATYPWNPFVQIQLLPATGGTNSTHTNYYIWLMQRFELAHQRRYREESAAAALDQIRWSIHYSELLNIAQSTRLYFTALYQRELYELANQTAQLNEELLGVTERRFNAGLATAAQVMTARVAARQSRRQARLAEATYQAALLALRQHMFLPATTPIVFSHRLGDYSWRAAMTFCDEERPPGEGDAQRFRQLAGELVEGRPDVLAALAGANVASANYRLANAARLPDFQAGPILNAYPNGVETVGVRFQTDLPLWNSGGPLARQRSAEWQQQVRVYQQLKARAAIEAETAIDRYERARVLAAESKVDLSPFAERMPAELKEINEQFQAAQADILTVFATQNSLLQERRTYLDLLSELAQAAADVIRATGLPVERIVTVDDGADRP
jgi:cobalt-zinc-cadmium efflux system outer membrane protein